jgi:phenylpyruvate tautomerase PptA (4-oxalocrotonate tautomerase family)
MPLLSIRTSAPQPENRAVEKLLLELSARVARHLGKPESYVMTSLEADVPMTFAGSFAGPSADPTDDPTADPVAYLEIRSVGSISPEATKAMSADFCRLIEERLGVPASRIYIAFSPCEGYLWGWNGRTFG